MTRVIQTNSARFGTDKYSEKLHILSELRNAVVKDKRKITDAITKRFIKRTKQ